MPSTNNLLNKFDFFSKFISLNCDNVNVIQLINDFNPNKDYAETLIRANYYGKGVSGNEKLIGKEMQLEYMKIPLKTIDTATFDGDVAIINALCANPSTNCTYYANGKHSKEEITASDKINCDMLGKIKRFALKNEQTAMKPIKIDRHGSFYILLLNTYQAEYLKRDSKYSEVVKGISDTDSQHPMFSNALGIFENDVIIHETSLLDDKCECLSGEKTEIETALLLGRQAAVVAMDNSDMYTNKYRFGIKKTNYKYDEVNDSDVGVVNIFTSSVK